MKYHSGKIVPICGSNKGYYTKQQAHGSVTYYYNFDGSIHKNSQMHDSITYTDGKVAYCKH